MKAIVIAYGGSECSEAILTELQHAGLGAGRARPLLGGNRAPMSATPFLEEQRNHANP